MNPCLGNLGVRRPGKRPTPRCSAGAQETGAHSTAPVEMWVRLPSPPLGLTSLPLSFLIAFSTPLGSTTPPTHHTYSVNLVFEFGTKKRRRLQPGEKFSCYFLILLGGQSGVPGFIWGSSQPLENTGAERAVGDVTRTCRAQVPWGRCRETLGRKERLAGSPGKGRTRARYPRVTHSTGVPAQAWPHVSRHAGAGCRVLHRGVYPMSVSGGKPMPSPTPALCPPLPLPCHVPSDKSRSPSKTQFSHLCCPVHHLQISHDGQIRPQRQDLVP